jgi:glucan endo-1,3-alpha-glucosidase
MLRGRNESGRIAGLCGLLVSLAAAQPGVLAGQPPAHYVFAHYMVCFSAYGQSTQGYEREIQEAQAVGIDGFLLDVGAWSGPDWYYKANVQLIYDAADQLNTGFKLSFFIELTNASDVLDMVSTYADRAPTLWYNGRPVLSAWGMNDVPSAGWTGANWTNGTNSILGLLQTNGYPVFFIPHFWPDPVTELPSLQDAQGLLAKYSFLDGLFLFGAAGLPAQLAQCNSNYTAAVHAAGKVFMDSVTPHYWGCGQVSNGRRYFETYGGGGIALQWKSIIANQPDWVNLVTWNDFNESTYVSPVGNPAAFFSALAAPVRYCHQGYLELSKRYIAWFKTGQEPPIDRDALFYFYRTHPMAAAASNTNDVAVSTFIGDVQDVLYTTVLLLKPADLQIVSGATSLTNSLPSGLNHLRTPFAPGAQTFTLWRNGAQVLSVQGPPIQSQIALYDFFPASGYAYGPPGPSTPPGNLRVVNKP